MIFFVIYLVAVWLGAFLLRRRPIGFVVALASAMPLVILGAWFQNGHDTLTIWSIGSFAFAGLVGLGAFFLVLQPRRPDSACESCGYDLAGIGSPVCPECGAGGRSRSPAAPQRGMLTPVQAEALRARRARATWSATDTTTTIATPITAASNADLHAEPS